MTTPFAANLVARISEIQQTIDGAQWQVTDIAVGTDGDGSVRVRLPAGSSMPTVDIHPGVVDPRRLRELEARIAAAVHDASAKLDQLRSDRILAAIRAMVDDLFVATSSES